MFNLTINASTGSLNKELPIVLQNHITRYLYLALPLCVVFTEEKLKPWFYERFIEISYHSSLNYIEETMINSGFNNILDTVRFSYSNIDGIDITELIINGINCGCYSYIFLNEFYLPVKENYNKINFYHDSLIYGYDSEKNEFLAIAFDKNAKFNILRYDYQSVFNAFINGKEYVPDYLKGIPLTLFKVKNFECSYPFNLYRFTSRLFNYINSIKNSESIFFAGFLNASEYYFVGFDIYPELLSSIIKRIEHLEYKDFLDIHFLLEHKNGLYNRLLFIKEKYCTGEKLNSFINEFYSIVQSFSKMRYLMLKYIHLYDLEGNSNMVKVNKIAMNIFNCFDKTIVNEKRILTSIYNELMHICNLNNIR